MNVLSGDCSCNMKGCSTTYELKVDTENSKNFLFIIKDDKHDLASWVSLDREDCLDIIKFLKSKYGKAE